MNYHVSISPAELDLRQCVSCGQVFLWREIAPDHWLGVDGGSWFRVLVTPEGLDVESNAPAEAFRSLFRLDVDQEEVERTIRQAAPELAPYIARFPGLRLMAPQCAVETLCCFLCTPNNHLSRITNMAQALHRYGDVLTEHDVHVAHCFPNLERIALIPEEELRALGFGYRARTIPEVARRIVDLGGEAWLLNLRRSEDYEAAFASLIELPGVGPKLADCIALFALHMTEAVPVDTHLWQAATRIYFPEWEGSSLTLARYRAVGNLFRSKFGKLAGLAHHYLFYDNMRRRARNKPAAGTSRH